MAARRKLALVNSRTHGAYVGPNEPRILETSIEGTKWQQNERKSGCLAELPEPNSTYIFLLPLRLVMADQNTDNSTSASPPAQPAASTSTTPQANAQPAAAAPAASQADMVALVQALARMQNGTQIDPAFSQNPAVQQLVQLVKSGKISHQQLLQVTTAFVLYFLSLIVCVFLFLVRKIWTKGTHSWCIYQRRNIVLNIDTYADCNSGTSALISGSSICLCSMQAPATPTSAAVQPSTAYKSAEAATSGPTLTNYNPGDHYPAISQTLNTTNPGAVQWPATRPTLSGGLASGRMSGMRMGGLFFLQNFLKDPKN